MYVLQVNSLLCSRELGSTAMLLLHGYMQAIATQFANAVWYH